MERSKFTEEQIALKQAESGITVAEVCRKMDNSASVFSSLAVSKATLALNNAE